jgi:hypothetical protein
MNNLAEDGAVAFTRVNPNSFASWNGWNEKDCLAHCLKPAAGRTVKR